MEFAFHPAFLLFLPTSFVIFMNFAAWNVRGMSDPIKAADVRKVGFENGISLVGLLETRVNHSNEVLIQQTINRR